MSPITPDLVPPDDRVRLFFKRNDLLVYINDELFFGFRTGSNVDWGNLCSCMNTVLGVFGWLDHTFRPRDHSTDESIRWDPRSREPFGDCKVYDFLASFHGETPHHPRPNEICFIPIQPRPRNRSKVNTPSTPSSLIATPSRGPSVLPTPVEELLQRSRPLETGPRNECASHRAATQNHDHASKAPRRCWDVYQRCCITGMRKLAEEDTGNPADVLAAHIFPHAYRELWVSSGWPAACTDRGPDNDCHPAFTGYHQICCLNNMILLRADVHCLWDAYEIGIDVNDNNRVISFSKGHAYLAKCHLELDRVKADHRPLSALLVDHLAQGVYLWCLYPHSKHACQRGGHLDSVAEALGTPLFEDEQLTRAHTQIDQYGPEDREHGEGKSAFENYLRVAFSVKDDSIDMLWPYGEAV